MTVSHAVSETEEIYNKFILVKRLDFISRSLKDSNMNWNYKGKGEICVRQDNNDIYFSEDIYIDENTLLKDRKMWRFEKDVIEFYHFRNKNYEKIFTFTVKGGEFLLKQKYECALDCYSGSLKIKGEDICFRINIRGKRKNEEITYIYTQS